jgi:transposase
LAADVTDESLMARLFVDAGVRTGARLHAEPDWSALVRELCQATRQTAPLATRRTDPLTR